MMAIITPSRALLGEKYLNHYDHKERHECDTSCIVCRKDNCLKTDTPVTCDECNMDRRSDKCYQNHYKYQYTERGDLRENVADLHSAKNGGNAQHVTKSSERINGRKKTTSEGNIYVPPVINT